MHSVSLRSLRRSLNRSLALLACWSCAMGAGAVDAAPDDTPMRIGSKRFTESYILAEVLAQQASVPGQAAPVLRQGLGNTAIVYEALRSGAIDLYPEYLGTISLEILKNPAPMDLAATNLALAPLGLGVALPLGFNDGYALAMRAPDATQRSIRTLSDLALHPDLRLGLSNEFIGRADGWPGLAARYRLAQRPIGLDHGLAYDAVAAQQIDVMDIYTTDAKIAHLGLRVLADDQGYFPRYDAVILYRLDVPQRHPLAWSRLQALAGSIDEAAMIAMNARAELQGVAFDLIARDHLAKAAARPVLAGAGRDAAARGFSAKLFGPDLARLGLQHLMLVGVSVGLAILLAVPVGVLVFPHARIRALVLGATGLLQTVPSIALLAVLIWLLGAIGTLPALVALTLYALLPIMRNTVAGLLEIPLGMRMAAQSLGLSTRQSLRLVELPLALPSIIAGVRTATAIAIGTATIAAFVGAGGFGERIVTGLALNDGQLLLAGALPAALLALLSEALFELLDRSLRRHAD